MTIKEIKAKKSTWDRTWSKRKKIKIDNTNLVIFNKIKEHVNFKNKDILELGAGGGRLSWLALKNGAHSVTLIDYSQQALNHAQKLFGESFKKVSFIQADLFKFKSPKKYDLVFSSGLIEHFKGQKFNQCVQKHFNLSKDLVLFIVPASPHYNDLRAKMKNTIRDFGWQRPIKLSKMKEICCQSKAKILINQRFYGLYGTSYLSLIPLPKFIDKKIGGLIITICKNDKKNN